MTSIRDIHFDHFYQQASYWTLLIYQLDRVGIEIPLPNAQLMSFLRVFDNLTTCRDFILEYQRSMVTLFIYSENMQKWWTDHQDVIPYNLQQIYIFCSTPDDVSWMNTYTERFKPLIKDTFLHNRLDDKILYYAVGLIDKILPEFQGDALDGLKTVRRRLCRALSSYFDDQSRC